MEICRPIPTLDISASRYSRDLCSNSISNAQRFINPSCEWLLYLVEGSRSDIQKYIGIHVRHRDFRNWCGQVPVDDCFASIAVLARRVEEIKIELRESRGITVEHVIMTSDEKDESWWEQVAKQGWYIIDHSGTVERYGAWYVQILVTPSIQYHHKSLSSTLGIQY